MASYCIWGKIKDKENISRGINWIFASKDSGFLISKTKCLEPMKELGIKNGDNWYFSEKDAWCAVGIPYHKEIEESGLIVRTLQEAINIGWKFFPDWMNKWYPHLQAKEIS